MTGHVKPGKKLAEPWENSLAAWVVQKLYGYRHKFTGMEMKLKLNNK